MDTSGAKARRADYPQACLVAHTPSRLRRQATTSTRMPASPSDRHLKPLREQRPPAAAYRLRVRESRRERPHQATTNVGKVSTSAGCPSSESMGPQLPIANAVRVSTTASLWRLSAHGYRPRELFMNVLQASMSASPRYRNVRGYRLRVPSTSAVILSIWANYRLAIIHVLRQACLRL